MGEFMNKNPGSRFPWLNKWTATLVELSFFILQKLFTSILCQLMKRFFVISIKSFPVYIRGCQRENRSPFSSPCWYLFHLFEFLRIFPELCGIDFCVLHVRASKRKEISCFSEKLFDKMQSLYSMSVKSRDSLYF